MAMEFATEDLDFEKEFEQLKQQISMVGKRRYSEQVEAAQNV